MRVNFITGEQWKATALRMFEENHRDRADYEQSLDILRQREGAVAEHYRNRALRMELDLNALKDQVRIREEIAHVRRTLTPKGVWR